MSGVNVICVGSGPVVQWCVVVVSFFNWISPGCEFGDEGLSRIRVEGSEFELGESLDGFGVVDDL